MRNILSVFLSVLALAGSYLPAQAIKAVAQDKAPAPGGTRSPLAKSISIDLGDVPVEVAIHAIAQKAGVTVAYSRAKISTNRKISLRSSNISVEDAIRRVIAPAQVRISALSDGQIVIAPVESQQRGTVQGIITGRVVDGKTNKGIVGANVTVDNDTRGVVTGEDGSYRFGSVPVGKHTVTIRLVGYAKESRSVMVGEGAAVTADFRLEPSANVLDQVVVTGTIVQTELKAVPNAITVVTAKQIEERGITRIDQLFRGDIPGLFSSNAGTGAQLDEVTMFSRGATAFNAGLSGSAGTANGTNPIKTYIDGVEMSNPRYLSQIDPSSIERIEILTGPQASTIYGSNAINGVMQIFTKRGTTAKPQVTLSLISGIIENTFNSHLAPSHVTDGMVSGTEGRWSYNVGGSWDYIGAWSPAKQTQRLSANGGGRMGFGKFTADVSGRHGFTKNNQRGDATAKLRELATTGVIPPRSTGTVPQTQTLDGRTLGLNLGFRPLAWWSHELVLGSDISKTESARTAPGFGTFPAGSDTALSMTVSSTSRRSERYTTTVQVPLSSVAGVNLAVGGEHWRTNGYSWNASPVALTGNFASVNSLTRTKGDKNRGAFVQGQIAFIDALFFTYGVRADWNPNFGDDVKVKPGRYGVSYTRDIGPVSAKLRGSYGRSIRPPTSVAKVAVLAGPTNVTSGTIGQFGLITAQLANPNLEPEYQQGGEGGMELYFGSRASLVVTHYNQTVDNLIFGVNGVDSVRSLTNTTPSFNCSSVFRDDDGYCYYYQLQYLNVGSIRNQGWELQSSINMGPFTSKATYSWTTSRVIGITPRYRAKLPFSLFQPGRTIALVPEHTWALNTTYAKAGSTVSLSINGVSRIYNENSIANELGLLISSARIINTQPRMNNPTDYRVPGSGYTTADLNATHRFSSRIDALFQTVNLTDYKHSDVADGQHASIGRQTKAGLRIRLN